MEARKDYLLRDRIPQAPKTAEAQEAQKDTHIILFNDEDCSEKFANGQVQSEEKEQSQEIKKQVWRIDTTILSQKEKENES